MANAAEYRKIFAPEKRAKDKMEDLVAYIKGSSSFCLAELLGDLSLSELSSMEQTAKEAAIGDPLNIKLRQIWIYFAALKRDLTYGYRGNNWLKQVGLNGLLRENYGGAKIAVDSGVEDE